MDLCARCSSAAACDATPREEHELLPLITGPFIAAQMSEELVWELFVQGGPIGETRIIRMVSILQCLVLHCKTVLAVGAC